jgi:hypothetical protein
MGSIIETIRYEVMCPVCKQTGTAVCWETHGPRSGMNISEGFTPVPGTPEGKARLFYGQGLVCAQCNVDATITDL